mmetsp:Transcript_48116/g.85393  ORF Transcript_48116/g.85393 Transcript_48116/m.85393 type:complete len:113 (+) Transcript_48116:93-431(+)
MCFEWCCPECFTPECNCRCGESIALIGIAVLIAASLFWVVGLAGWEKVAWYYYLNMFFFVLGAFCLGCGPIYAVCARGRKAFSREPALLEVSKEDKEKDGAAAPIPYVMCPA